MRKKIVAMFLAASMVFSLAACGSDGGGAAADSGEAAADNGSAGSEESGGSDINLAMITDSGDITDQSFNQTTYESCKKWAEQNGVEFT